MQPDLPDYALYPGERLLPLDRPAPCETCRPRSEAKEAVARLVWDGWDGPDGAGRAHRLCGACLDVRYGPSPQRR